ncbi:uncharacterized protein LOC115761870 isoform X2 [Drosophila novamexicana]|uniref:uncharacterized protein LOC115761870 isoform X2 n=1 Tax=Drosophila novamexicana TaxID=47314 RepID=UPI0011E5960C|nr:uncharacterized protein LOC115761870 isoform X2 [Drosophila novamexicana]
MDGIPIYIIRNASAHVARAGSHINQPTKLASDQTLMPVCLFVGLSVGLSVTNPYLPARLNARSCCPITFQLAHAQFARRGRFLLAVSLKMRNFFLI